jgi:hypothetical protein
VNSRALPLLAVVVCFGCKEGAAPVAADGATAAVVVMDASRAAAAAVDAAPAVVDAARPPDAVKVIAIDAAAVVDARPADARPADARPADGGGLDAGAAVVDAGKAAAVPGPDAATTAAVPVPPPPPPSGGSDEIIIDEPRVVGDVDVQPILESLEKVKPQLEGCRPRGAETAKVKVQFHVGLGKLGLAAPAADNTGDASVARCIANRVKSSRPAFKEGESGIIIVEATVPPRK